MRLLLLLVIVFSAWALNAQTPNITKLEYFIDTDPGYGLGTNLSITPATVLNDITFSIPVNSLADGFHTLFIRSRDANNNWSIAESRLFYKLSTSAQAPLNNINKLEYFIDTDPGYGLGTNLFITPATVLNDITFSIPVNSLSDGFHTLFIRSRDANNNWSITESRLFYKLSTSAQAPLTNINKLEYFIDTDPGYDLGTNLSITPATVLNDITFSIPVNSLTDGFHTLFLRSRDANNNWSITESRLFYKLSTSTEVPLANINKLEYFIGADPGYGAGVNVPITPATSINNQSFFVPVASLAEGTYTLTVRARDGNNKWSVVVIKTISVCNHPGTNVNDATAITSSSFTVSWADVPGSIQYLLDVSTDNFNTFVSGYNAKVITAPALSTTITGLAQATTYQYRVRAMASCASVLSNSISVTTLATPPVTQPSNLLFSSVTSSTLTGFFTAPATAPTGYLVIRKAGSVTSFTPVNNTNYTKGQVVGDGVVAHLGSGVIFNETGLTPNTQYFYTVFAFNQANGAISYLTTAPLQNNIRTIALEPAAQPTNLQFASVTDVSFSVSFTAASGTPDGYLVLRKIGTPPTSVPVDGTVYTTSVGTDVVAYQGNATNFTQSGLSPNTQYFYTVYAYNGTANAINYRTATPLTGSQLTPITAPATGATNIVFSNVTPNSVTVSYTPSTSTPSGYLVVRKAGVSSSFIPQANTAYNVGQTLSDGSVAYVGTANSFNDTGLTSSTTYFYDVYAFNQVGSLIGYQTVAPLEGNTTTFTSEPVAQPGTLVFATTTASSITVSYTAANPNPGGYLVLRNATSAPTTLPVDGISYSVGQVLGDATVAYSGSSTSFTDSGLTSGTLYFYQVFSFNGSGSASNYLTTLNANNSGSKITVPGKPVFNTPNTTIGQNQFTLSWPAVTGASNYRIDVSKDNFITYVAGFNNITIGSTSIAVTGLESGIPYKFRLRAVNESGTSTNSDEGQQFTIPATPVLTAATNVEQASLTANWNAVNGATGYFLDVSLSNTFNTFESDYQNKPLSIVTSETISNLAPGKTYYYRVRSTNSGGTSPDSNPSGTQLLKPATPEAKQPSNVTSAAFKALWQPVEGATEYRIDVALLSNDFGSPLTNYNNRITDASSEQLVSGLAANTAYKYRVRAINATGASLNSNTISVSTLELGSGSVLQLTNLSFNDEFTGNPISVSVEVSGGLSPYVVNFYYRKITGSDFSVRPLSSSSTSYQTTIDASMLDDLGLEFYFQALDANSETKVTSRQFVYKAFTSQIKIPFTKFGGTAESYEMFSIPYQFQDNDNFIESIFDELGEYDKTRWRLVRFQGGKNVDFKAGINKIELGKGYWINRKEDIGIFINNGSVINSSQSSAFVMKLEKGWNQIGNPFPFNIDWSDVLEANPTKSTEFDDPTILRINNSGTAFIEGDDLPEWGAGFVFANEAVELDLPVTLKNTASGGRKHSNLPEGNLDEPEWYLPITIRLNETIVSYGGVGMHPEASSLKDPFDKLTPPRFINYLEFSSVHPEFFHPYFSRDVVPEHEQFIWTFTAESNLGGEDSELQWDASLFASNDAQLVLLDVESFAWVDMKQVNHYGFKLNSPRAFKIFYSRNTDKINPYISGSGKAYPNPLTDVSTIPYVVGTSGWAEIIIYDLNGKKLKTLVSAQTESGFYTTDWNGTDIQENRVAGGVYLCRFTLNNKTISVNKIIVR